MIWSRTQGSCHFEHGVAGTPGQVHVASGAGARNREERAPWGPSTGGPARPRLDGVMGTDGLKMHDGVDEAAHGGHSKDDSDWRPIHLQSGLLATTCQQHRPPAMHGRPTSRPPARVRASK